MKKCYPALALLICMLQAGCMSGPAQTMQPDSPSKEQFQTAWDHAIDRLHYDDVVRSWGPPTSVLRAGNIVANWHWNHALILTKDSTGTELLSQEQSNLSFGERMELSFNAATGLLQGWKFLQWGPQSGTYKYVQGRVPGIPILKHEKQD
jgi:hypothetical protein